MPRIAKISLVAAFLSLLVSLLSALQLIGHTVRVVDIVGLFGGGMGAGAGLTAALMTARRTLPAPLREPALSPEPQSISAQDK